MRGRVSRLSQAIGSFSQARSEDAALPAANAKASTDTTQATLVATSNAVAVSRLVGAMKRYDSSGSVLDHTPNRLVAAPGSSTALESEATRNALLVSPIKAPFRSV